MKVLAVLGSRNPQGQTARAVDALLRGVEAEGGRGAKAFLPQLTIERCRQCDQAGWGDCKAKGKCVIEEDDFASLVDQIDQADAVVFATPVYYGDLSESMRAFTDRLRRISMHEAGKAGRLGTLAIGICVAGEGGGSAPECAVSLKKVVIRCGFDVVDMVPARRQNLDHKVEVLELTGRWLARSVAE